jgi:hypothetical protein
MILKKFTNFINESKVHNLLEDVKDIFIPLEDEYDDSTSGLNDKLHTSDKSLNFEIKTGFEIIRKLKSKLTHKVYLEYTYPGDEDSESHCYFFYKDKRIDKKHLNINILEVEWTKRTDYISIRIEEIDYGYLYQNWERLKIDIYNRIILCQNLLNLSIHENNEKNYKNGVFRNISNFHKVNWESKDIEELPFNHNTYLTEIGIYLKL